MMSHDTRSLAHIVHERQDGWRHQADHDRRSIEVSSGRSSTTGRRPALWQRPSLVGLRRRIAGASAEA